MENNTPESMPADHKNSSSAEPAKDDSQKSAAVKRSPRPSSRHRRHSSSWWVRLSIFISWLAAGAAISGCYWLYMQLDVQQAQQQMINAELATLTQQEQALTLEIKQALITPTRRIEQLERQQSDYTKAYQQLAELKQAQQQLQQRIAIVAQRSPNHWMAAEAEYLIGMAGRKLWLEKDPQTASLLLQTADNRIEAMKDPALHQLRKALAQDIAATKAIKTTDISGAVYKIDALIEQISRLPLNQVDTEIQPDPLAAPITDSIDDWQTNLAKSFKQFMDGFITIRERTTDLEPLLPVEQHWYLVENVRHKLLQSQMALYNYDQKAYQNSVNYALNWTKQYFDNSDSNTQHVIKQLEQVSQLKIESIHGYQFKSTPLIQQLVSYGDMMPTEEPSL
ncbi:uroporphyrinogen-III C-methyltransferase [Shewanella aestuarii]|uniref:Uroporphyrinogen-III methylase n=1 Tax=Shewanella aestuarii TaxID=1028752 RepID=A0A6G9QNZ0_9GAMM|nr:uroporphyrinogen-III C-methyltransferase [Shewanella aestuarii]QIR15767.1 uroporphyrinogen-III methylase [Shewanella aestuarii]